MKQANVLLGGTAVSEDSKGEYYDADGDDQNREGENFIRGEREQILVKDLDDGSSDDHNEPEELQTK
jgi:hypothetical protein